jgi:hypothetical protein
MLVGAREAPQVCAYMWLYCCKWTRLSLCRFPTFSIAITDPARDAPIVLHCALLHLCPCSPLWCPCRMMPRPPTPLNDLVLYLCCFPPAHALAAHHQRLFYGFKELTGLEVVKHIRHIPLDMPDCAMPVHQLDCSQRGCP